MVARTLALCLAVALVASAALLTAQGVTYVYDNAGRLVAVINGSGEAAVYAYDAVGNLLSITRQPAGAVSVLSFTPDNGSAGTTVTVYGTGFSATPSSNTVQFDGAGATVSAATTTALVVSVPSGASTGPISVTSPLGSATSSKAFTVGGASAPTISGFSPVAGGAGEAFTISGTNFETTPANNEIKLGVARSVPTASTATSVDAVVPSGTGSGKVGITTPGGTAVSVADFFLAPSPYTGADVGSTATLQTGQAVASTIPTGGKIGLAVFAGNAGQRLSLKVVPGPSGSVTIYRPNGSVLLSRSASLAILLEPGTLTGSGTYTVCVDPTGSGTGTVTLTLYEVPADLTGTLTPGTGQIASLGTPGQNARYTFLGTLAQRISLTISSGPGGTVSILNPDSTVLSSASIGILTSFIDTTTLGSAGTYTVLVDPFAANTGSVTVTLYVVPADYSGTISPGGQPVAVPTATPGQNGSVSFAASAGQRIALKVDAFAPGGTVTMVNPDTSTLASVGSGIVAAFVDTKTLPATGTYTIKVDPTGANTGTTRLTLYSVPADFTGTVTIGGPGVAVPIGAVGQNGSLTFAGSANQQVTVHVTNNAMGAVTVKLLKPDGSQMTTSTSMLGTFNLATQTLPTAGTYTVVVDPSQWATGSLTITVTSP